MNFFKKLLYIFILICIALLIIKPLAKTSANQITRFLKNFESNDVKNTQKIKLLTTQEISILDKQILQQKYLIASDRASLSSEQFDKSEKQTFIDEAINDLRHSDSEADRELAVMTLGEVGGPQSVEGISFALKDQNIIVREEAIHQISKWKNRTERLELTLKVLKSNDPDAVILLLESIKEIKDEKLIRRIKTLLKHPNKDVRNAAELALRLQN